MTDEQAFERVARLWWLVLLRGVVPSALALVLVAAPSLTLREASWTVAAVVLAGSALELALAWQLRSAAPRGTLWFTGAAGLGAAGLVLATASTTLVLLLSVVGAWLGVRGLATLWVALSMRRLGGGAWLLLLAIAFLSVGAGVVLLFWTALQVEALALPAALYALCYGALHALAARRIRAEPSGWVAAARD